MRKIITLYVLIFCSITNISAQNYPTFTKSQLATLADDISSKAKLLCDYIVMVGSTDSGVSDAEKDVIIRDYIRPLFWNYTDRVMKTTGGAYGTTVRSKPMSQYFINLKAQARPNLNRQIKYEIAYDEVYSTNTMYDVDSWEKMENLSDGCQVWRNSIRIKQKYYVIDYTLNNMEHPNKGQITHFEGDDKYLYVYIIKDPKGGNVGRLGDVYMAIRTETVNVK